MCKFYVVMEAVMLGRKSKGRVPFHPFLLPVFIPFLLCAGTYEELHLHLFELTHAENELPRHDLIAKSLSYLRNAEGYLHPGRLLHIQEIDKNTLCGLRTQVDFIRIFGD